MVIWYLYLLECADDTLYCGITNHIVKRLEQHNTGKGAKYTRGRGPVKLLALWPHADRSEASKAEYAFKKLSKNSKLRAIGSSLSEAGAS